MATNVADLVATLRMDAGQFNRTAQQVSGQAQTMGSRFGSLGTMIKGAIGVVAVKQVLDFGAAMFRVGMESEAFGRKYRAVFGENTSILDAWVTEHHEAFGVAEDEVQGYLAQIGNLLTGMGMAADEAGRQATKILELAGAWSAWSGGQISVQDASDKLVKGMMGQTRGLIELGLKVTEQEVNARMAAQGLDQLTGAEASRAQQQVMWTLIQEKSTTAVGAYGEALGGAYGAAMDMSTAVDEMKDAVGEMVVGISTAALPAVASLVEALTTLSKAPALVTTALGAIAGGMMFGPVGAVVGGAVGFGLAMADVGTGKLQEMETAQVLWDAALNAGRNDRAVYIKQLRDLGGVGITLADNLVLVGDSFYVARDAMRDFFSKWRPQEFRLFGGVEESAEDTADTWLNAFAQRAATRARGAPLVIDPYGFDLRQANYEMQQAIDDAIAGIAARSGGMRRAVQASLTDPFKKSRRDVMLQLQGMEQDVGNFFQGLPEAMQMPPGFSIADLIANQQAQTDLENRMSNMMQTAGALGLDNLVAELGSLSSSEWQTLFDMGLTMADIINLGIAAGDVHVPVRPPTWAQYYNTGTWTPTAAGGPVYPAGQYLVGEKGPELFVPDRAGTVIPNNQINTPPVFEAPVFTPPVYPAPPKMEVPVFTPPVFEAPTFNPPTYPATQSSTYAPTVNVHVAGSVISDRELARIIEDQMIRTSRRGGSSEVF